MKQTLSHEARRYIHIFCVCLISDTVHSFVFAVRCVIYRRESSALGLLRRDRDFTMAVQVSATLELQPLQAGA